VQLDRSDHLDKQVLREPRDLPDSKVRRVKMELSEVRVRLEQLE
jgi:hypothetical protein